MNKYTPEDKTNPIIGLNGQLMVMAAHRYCLGRQSYIVPACIEWLTYWWDTFEHNTKCVIIRDTVEALQDDMAGSKYDKEMWTYFCKKMFDNFPDESKNWVVKAVEHKRKPFPF